MKSLKARQAPIRTAVALSLLVLIVGLSISFGMTNAIADAQRRGIGEVMDRRTELVQRGIASETARYLESMQTVAAGLGSQTTLTHEDFLVATAPLKDIHLAGASSISYLVPATNDQIPAVQQFWRDRGVEGLTLTPQGNAPEHLFAVLSQSLDGRSKTTVGIDASQSPTPTAALNESRRSGKPAVTDAYQLLTDRSLPEDQRQMSFALTVPVYGPDANGVTNVFKGWVTMGLRGQDFLGSILSQFSQDQVDVALQASNSNGQRVVVSQLRTHSTAHRDVSRQTSVKVAEREWQITTEAVSSQLLGHTSAYPNLVGAVLVSTSLMLTMLVFVLATDRSRAESRVREATRELSDAEQKARHQADLLNAVMMSISDGVGVVDANGEFLLHNPAAKALLGVDDVGGTSQWQGHYGLFLPDGKTPFDNKDLPLVRALGGESIEGVEMIVRNAARPEGVLIAVGAMPLDSSAGQTGAVAVFRDITAVRRYEADLRAFAGIVAHDLKSPLTTIAGYGELLSEHINADTSDGSEMARRSVDRLLVGTKRMAKLIDDLLSYSAARDAALTIEPVNLQTIVNDVVSARIEQAGLSESGIIPNIYVGSLPEIEGDTALLRQVFDNLVSNAIKYTLPGATPRIDISASNDNKGFVSIAVADRGIGIPADQHTAIFASFHRAHAGAGYSGTGMGLAICQRVVERHGGTIAVEDNVGGGARFVISIPTAQTSIGDSSGGDSTHRERFGIKHSQAAARV